MTHLCMQLDLVGGSDVERCTSEDDRETQGEMRLVFWACLSLCGFVATVLATWVREPLV